MREIDTSAQLKRGAALAETSVDLSNCLILNTVTAARTLLRHYDAKLQEHDITAQQFALLCAIRLHPGESVAALAQRVHLDRTSLTRNLDVLERKKLARRIPAGSGNLRLCELSKQGNLLLDELLPQWQQYTFEAMAGISAQDAETYLAVARHLTSRHA